MGKILAGQVTESYIMFKHPLVVVESRLDRIPFPNFLSHLFTSLITYFKYNFWHNVHLFTDLGGCSEGESQLRELPISFPLPKSHCVYLPCWKAEVMLGVFICLKPGVMRHHGDDISQQARWWLALDSSFS